MIETIVFFILINTLIVVTVLGAHAIKANDCREIVACLQAQHPEGAPMAVLNNKDNKEQEK